MVKIAVEESPPDGLDSFFALQMIIQSWEVKNGCCLLEEEH